jgi:hypothetical protein
MEFTTTSSRIREVLERPLSPLWCALSWFGSTGIYVLVVWFLGGPAPGDSAESVYSTWSIAHLNLACAYPPATHAYFPPNASPFASVAPLYPILSSIASALFRFGHRVAFPTGATMGVHCSNAYVAMYKWSLAANSLHATLEIAYVGWFVVMVGVIALLRASGRGRNGWEVITLFVLAIVPPMYTSITSYFHPQDLVAMGLILLAVASATRGSWTWTGAFLGLSFTSQQFALLAIAALLIVVPRGRRLSMIAATVLTVCIVDLPFIVASSGRAFKTLVVGTNRVSVLGVHHFHAAGGTVLFATQLRGVGLFIVARVLPILSAAAVAYWAKRRLGPKVTETETLTALVATALCMRLVFEENLFGYYFLAVAVSLVCVEALRGRFSGKVLTWLGMVFLAFTPIPWWVYLKWEPRGLNFFMLPPLAFEVIVVSAIAVGIRNHHIKWYLIIAGVVVALTCFPPLWGRNWTIHFAPSWLWQLILVPTGLYLVSQSLRSAVRTHRLTEAHDVATVVT